MMLALQEVHITCLTHSMAFAQVPYISEDIVSSASEAAGEQQTIRAMRFSTPSTPCSTK